jgi:diaminohydroxyphosphoribosylaminopyrimidine deaminase/5-amino-6-(5-phosphoribosylamino)uracil reductase
VTAGRGAGVERFMRLALEEAGRGLGRTAPNPAVGAVLVRGGRVVGRGHHARAGSPHAEIEALRLAGARARGADLYTTLEPCDHFGRTPPCSLAVIEAGVRRVFVGSRDPNPVVNGKGSARLRRAGVEVVTGPLQPECDALNAPWFRFVASGRPFVTLKLAATLDGRIATGAGDSRWVSGPAARAWVHQLRDRVDAVLVGRGTVQADDPRLTTRLPAGAGRDPLRVVLDTDLQLPASRRLFRQRSTARTLVLHAARGERDLGPRTDLQRCARGPGGLDLADVLARLAARGVVHLLVEGGAAVAASFLAAGLVDRLALVLAPKVLGAGLSWSGAVGPARMSAALQLRDLEVTRLGDDLLLQGTPALAAATRRG